MVQVPALHGRGPEFNSQYPIKKNYTNEKSKNKEQHNDKDCKQKFGMKLMEKLML